MALRERHPGPLQAIAPHALEYRARPRQIIVYEKKILEHCSRGHRGDGGATCSESLTKLLACRCTLLHNSFSTPETHRLTIAHGKFDMACLCLAWLLHRRILEASRRPPCTAGPHGDACANCRTAVLQHAGRSDCPNKLHVPVAHVAPDRALNWPWHALQLFRDTLAGTSLCCYIEQTCLTPLYRLHIAMHMSVECSGACGSTASTRSACRLRSTWCILGSVAHPRLARASIFLSI